MSEKRLFSSEGRRIAGPCVLIATVSALVAMAAVVGGDVPSVFENPHLRVQMLSEANTAFAWDLYTRQAAASAAAAAQHQNIFMSPLSVSVAMAMTYVGARAQTRAQMTQVMRFNDHVEDDQLHRAFTDLLTALNQTQPPHTLYMANRMFGDKSYSFLDEFLSTVREHYGAELARVDFRYA